MTADPHSTSGGRRCVHDDSVAAVRALLQMLSELFKLKVGGVGQDTDVVALTLLQRQVMDVHEVLLQVHGQSS